MLCQKELQAILQEEGFSSTPYLCTEGVPTIGHGLTSLTHDESAYIVEFFRLPAVERDLKHRLPWLDSAHPEIQKILIHMAYQIGCAGVCKFHNTLAAIQRHDYQAAADEMLDSLWAKKQSPNRAKRLSDRVRALSK